MILLCGEGESCNNCDQGARLVKHQRNSAIRKRAGFYIFWHNIEFYDDSARTNVIGVMQYKEYALLPRVAG